MSHLNQCQMKEEGGIVGFLLLLIITICVTRGLFSWAEYIVTPLNTWKCDSLFTKNQEKGKKKITQLILISAETN